jgi:hypothetical protein
MKRTYLNTFKGVEEQYVLDFKDYGDGAYHTESPGLWTLPIVRNSK